VEADGLKTGSPHPVTAHRNDFSLRRMIIRAFGAHCH